MGIGKQNLSQRKLDGYLEYCKIIEWGRKNPARFVELMFGIEFLDLQKYVFMNMWTTPFVLLCQCRNSGKALALDTNIPTVEGNKMMRDIKVGDYVFDDKGKPVKVKFISDIFYGHKCYEIEFEDGEKIVADEEHLWDVKVNSQIQTLKTKEIFKTFKNNISVPKIHRGFKKILNIRAVKSVPTKCIGVNSKKHLYLCGYKNTVTHNSTISAPYLMAKSMLYPNFYSYIISTNGNQAQETFLKIEKICKRQLSSFTGLTDVFQNEIITSNANKDGFTHKPESFTFELFNGSKVHTLNSNYDGSRGKRSMCNFYDETGFMAEKAFSATEPFTTQDANFKMGGDIDVSLEPKTFPNQLIYASSASSIDTYFFKKYKEFSKQMILGNKNYFVADINCDLVLNPMFNGKLYPVALLTQEKIDNAMRENREQALREYRNIFSKEGGESNPFKRGTIIRNSEVRKPLLCNEGNKSRHIVGFYDPARSFDNSVVLFAEFIEDKKLGWVARILNCVSLVDIGTKKKIPMRTPEQVEYIRNLLVDYNGNGFGEYENIGSLLVDSGAGGAGVNIADYFMEEWKDARGNTHKGLIDKEESKEYVGRFPDAINKLKLISPKKYRTEMFDALKEMMDMDLISFTETYDGKGHLMIPYETELDVIDPETKQKQKEIKYQRVELSFEEELALRNIDIMKEEIVQIQRIENAERTSHKYSLPSEKQNTMHDDRAYTLSMCGWYLKQLRRKNITEKKEDSASWDDMPILVSEVNFKI